MLEKISLKGEMQRKLIHISSGLIPIMVIFYGKSKIIPFLLLFTILFILFDFLKNNVKWVQIIYKFFFKALSRKHEITHFTGASYVLIGYLITLLFFSENIAVFSMFVLCFSDSSAALIGRVYGKNKIGNKTLEGTFAFILVGLLISLFFQSIPLPIRVLAIFLAAVIELTAIRINDNLSIPSTISIVCYIGMSF
ncbi:MAG: hypothetical protein CMF96_11585 [Candidatus Marinimicrobia bacterium]|nr:hypothetical protein [Candidatus Neomarinimicrobiota bacterium]|tara:strand:+ start:1419 stop:2003 length:585 start_codon:yes stop_codon:yes gene_type:complete